MDILCQAKSGMGKTAVFVLSILQQLDPKPGEVSAIIMCHTRELAYQVRARSLEPPVCACVLIYTHPNLSDLPRVRAL